MPKETQQGVQLGVQPHRHRATGKHKALRRELRGNRRAWGVFAVLLEPVVQLRGAGTRWMGGEEAECHL